MGQAQLLLIVLGVVLVGIAIIAGIQAYSQNNVKASIDAQVHDMMRIASDMQTWVQKPPQFGGPDTYANFAEIIDFSVLSYKNSDGNPAGETWTNVNAMYTLNDGAQPTVVSNHAELNTSVALTVCGINDNDIFVVTSNNGAATPADCD